MSTAIIPGSFDPITLGHLNIIRRTSKIFDNVIVAVMKNVNKTSPMFTFDEKFDMINKSIAKYPNVQAVQFDGLLSEYAKQYPGSVIVKGLRAVSDFEYEFQMNNANKIMNPELETMFLTSDVKYTFLSSSIVRELAYYGADLKGLVPDEIIDDIYKKAEVWRKK